MVLSARKRVQGQCTQHACRLEGTDGKETGKPICANAVTTSGLWHVIRLPHLQERCEGCTIGK